MSLRIQRCESPRQLLVGGELDLATAPELQRVLGTISSSADITLDLEFLSFVDEAGLQLLLSTADRLDGSLVLLSPPATLVRLLNLMTPPAPGNLVLQVSAEEKTPTRARPGSATA